jgi:FkbM family methyltransferase
MRRKGSIAAGRFGVTARIAQWGVRLGGLTAFRHPRDFRSVRGRLPPRIKVLAFLMRRMPTGIRKFHYWWDNLYWSINKGVFDDVLVLDDGVGLCSHWPAGVHGPVRSRRFGYKVWLDLRVWSERSTYFSGAYYRRDLEYLFPLILRRGDQYLDIGANIGMTSLMASSLIGDEGEGFAFEPNPETFARLRRHFELNHTSNLKPVPLALWEAEMDLVLPTGSSGLGSLAFHRGPKRSFNVWTCVGDHYLKRLNPQTPTIIKIDVEGHELRALSGIKDVLDWPEVVIVAEVNDVMLRPAGDPAELVALLEEHEFHPLFFDRRIGRFGSELNLTDGSVRDAIAKDRRNLLFAKPESKIYFERITPLLWSAYRRSVRRQTNPPRSTSAEKTIEESFAANELIALVKNSKNR